MTDTTIQTTPLVQVVSAGLERVFAFSEIAMNGDDPATISDADLKQRVARYLDQDAHVFDDLIVTRPATGNVLLAPKPVYGKFSKTDIFAAAIAVALAVLVKPVVAPLLGMVTGIVLSRIMVFAGRWIADGAVAFGIPLSLENLPVACAFLAFVGSFITPRHTSKSSD